MVKINLTKGEATTGFLISVILQQIKLIYGDYNTNHTTGLTAVGLLAPITAKLIFTKFSSFPNLESGNEVPTSTSSSKLNDVTKGVINRQSQTHAFIEIITIHIPMSGVVKLQ